MMTRENVAQAEIRCPLKTVESKYSRLCDEINMLFQNMFPDSNIAKNFQLLRTKFGYIINHVGM